MQQARAAALKSTLSVARALIDQALAVTVRNQRADPAWNNADEDLALAQRRSARLRARLALLHEQ